MTSRGDAGIVLFKSLLAAAGLLLTAFLLWALRSLIVPVVVSGLLAYISRPLVAALERYRIPRGGAVAMLMDVKPLNPDRVQRGGSVDLLC